MRTHFSVALAGVLVATAACDRSSGTDTEDPSGAPQSTPMTSSPQGMGTGSGSDTMGSDQAAGWESSPGRGTMTGPGSGTMDSSGAMGPGSGTMDSGGAMEPGSGMQGSGGAGMGGSGGFGMGGAGMGGSGGRM